MMDIYNYMLLTKAIKTVAYVMACMHTREVLTVCSMKASENSPENAFDRADTAHDTIMISTRRVRDKPTGEDHG